MPESELTKVSVGIDVSKNTLDIAVHETGETWSSNNDSSGGAALATKLKQLKATSIVLEAHRRLRDFGHRDSVSCGLAGDCNQSSSGTRLCQSYWAIGQDRSYRRSGVGPLCGGYQPAIAAHEICRGPTS